MTSFDIEINDASTPELRSLIGRLEHPEPAMRAIAMALLSQTEDNFAAESGPLGLWPDLAPATKEARAKAGKWPGKKLQVSAAGLAASVTPFWSDTEAGIGSSVIYAAIQHLGGKAGRGHQVEIPARPYMPVYPDGRLQGGTDDEVLAIIQGFLVGQ